jgi:threonine dehydratase
MKKILLPDRKKVEANRAKISKFIIETPVLHLHGPTIEKAFGHGTELHLKLEPFQPTGSFKVRSVLTFLLSLDKTELEKGVVTMSAGNHAAAVAYGAKCLGVSAKVIMPKETNPRKVALSTQYGADIIFVDDIRDAYAVIEKIERSEGRVFIPAWGDARLTLGTASLALELIEQCPPLDAFIVAIGGGSVCAGAGPLLKSIWTDCKVLAAEPEGAPTMLRSFASGKVEHLDKSTTIAEGLAPPLSCEYFTSICRDCVDDLQAITNHQIVSAMRFLFEEAKLAIEPSGAGAMAGALGPFREQISGQRVAIVVSGSNIDFESFSAILNNPSFS